MLEKLLAAIMNSTLSGKLSGNKTYILGALIVLNGLYALIYGGVPTYDNPDVVASGDAVNQILEGLGLNTLRMGVKKIDLGA